MGPCNATKPAWATLPEDILVKIALCITDEVDVFVFFEVLRPHVDLDPVSLVSLVQLDLKVIYSSPWPTFTLDSTISETMSILSIEAIIKYYSHVVVKDTRYSVDWLNTHLNPTTTIEWSTMEFQNVVKTWEEWSSLRITKLNLHIDMDSPSTWKEVLPRLCRLTSLFVDDRAGNLEDIYAFVAKSKHIIDFKIVAISGFQIGNSELLHVHLLEWFRRQPVQRFDAWFTDWRLLDYNLRQALCEAMFNCPMFERLCLADCYLDDMDFTKFTFSIKTLELNEWCLHSNFLASLASRLEGSKVTCLELNDYVDDNNDDIEGIEMLFRCLPRTSIKSLSIYGLYFTAGILRRLSPQIGNCGLESLTIDSDFIPSVEHLGPAIQNNHTLCELRLLKCRISIPNMQRLMESFSHPNRLVKFKRIKWTVAKWQFLKV
ncbi:hypothetical protein LEN26_012936 [Aphanomyces euteiches]|nr:hypothetical protein LEN26_012936 [Aphanomyces euteiches]